MSSQNPPDELGCETLERLLAKVHSILARHHRTFNTLAVVGDTGASDHARIERLRESAAPVSPPPRCLTDALRSPAGRDRIINLTVCGKVVQAAIPPLGYVDVRVEEEVWRVIQRTTMEAES